MRKLTLVISVLLISCALMLWVSSRDNVGSNEKSADQVTGQDRESRPGHMALAPRSPIQTPIIHPVDPSTLPIRTNESESPVVIDQHADRRPLAQRLADLETAKNRIRERFAREGLYQDIAAREAEWKERSKGLKLGMSIEETIAIMSEQPNWRYVSPEISPDTVIEYTPDPNYKPGATTIAATLPYDHLSLVFDGDGKLTKMKWSYP